MSVIIDGKTVSTNIRTRIKDETETFVNSTGVVPGLAVIIVGEDPASQVYVRNKNIACGQVGFYSEVISLPQETSQEELLKVISQLSDNDKIHGILVQLPLPEHIDEQAVINSIPPHKDVDAFHPYNVGRMMIGNQVFVPCTPAGVMALLEEYKIDVEGKHCVIVGRSNIVGKPQAMLMLQKNATVTICHSKTVNLAEITRNADIIVAAVGRAKFIKGDMVKDGAVVIDVGINRNADGKLCGDIDFDEVSPKASFITPVPGGVGPMTITMLLKNTLASAKESVKNNN